MKEYWYANTKHERRKKLRGKEWAAEISQSRLNPSMQNPDYLIYRTRRKYFENLISDLKLDHKVVIDIGGRVQPYRSLLPVSTKYFGLDPIFEGLLNIVGIGEYLPIKSNSSDLIICTQTLSYVRNPTLFVSECHRILKKDSPAFISIPAFFPQHHDENWRFLKHGIEILFSEFKKVSIMPEIYSLGGFWRTQAVIVNQYDGSYTLKRIIQKFVIPFFNYLGKKMDKYSKGNEFLTCNYTVIAYK